MLQYMFKKLKCMKIYNLIATVRYFGASVNIDADLHLKAIFF